MAILICSTAVLLLLLLFCAVSDARSYRIPDTLTAPLFVCALVACLLPKWSVTMEDALGGFLFFYPALFLMWSGAPLTAPPVQPSSPPAHDLPRTVGQVDSALMPVSVRSGLFQNALGCLNLSRCCACVVPSPLTWILLLVLGGCLVSSTLWLASIVAVICCVLTALKTSSRMPWHGSRMASSWIGGGDAKMLAACTAMLGGSAAQSFALCLAVGNVLLIAYLKTHRRGMVLNEWEARRIPMGVAIAVSAGFLLLLNIILAMTPR